MPTGRHDDLDRDVGEVIGRAAAEGAVSDGERLFEAFLRESHVTGAHHIPALVRRHAAVLGAGDAVVYLVDLQQGMLVPFLAGDDGPALDPLGVESTLAGRVFQHLAAQVQHPAPGDDHASDPVTAWLPLLDGTERLGVLALTFESEDLLTDLLLMRAQRLASLVSELVMTRTLYGDTIVRLRRVAPMGLAAEMQWSLLPPLTYADDVLSLAGGLEPAYEVAGDAVDYAVNDGLAHLAVFDGMGHGLESAQLVNLVVGAYRNGRRGLRPIEETAAGIDEAVAAMYAGQAFSTGVVAQLDTTTGLLRWLTAGHHQPLLLRAGRLVRSLAVEPGLPFGFGEHAAEAAHVVGQESLQPGDLLLLYTDGVTEARSPTGEFFGVERLVDLVLRNLAAGLPAAETMRRVLHALLAHQGAQLRDDATLLLVQWHGPPTAD